MVNAPLSAEFLFGDDSMQRPVNMAQFTPPPLQSEHPRRQNGTLSWSSTLAAGFEVHEDRFDYRRAAGESLLTFPAASLEWLQVDGFVVPRAESVLSLDHPDWEIAFQPGRAWPSLQQRYTRFSVPFALIERNANCTHNGVLTWIATADGKVSRAAYQISSETCPYLKFDMWGLLNVTLQDAAARAEDDKLVTAFRESRQARLPIATFAALQSAYPEIDHQQFGAVANVNPADTTVYGFVTDGVHYRSDCPTRFGAYPFCDELLLPSYSTAKSIFAGLALMRLEALLPGAAEASIAALIPECATGWKDVSIGNALDMATGHYVSSGSEADEALPEHVQFLYADDHDARIRFACQFFPKKSPPGEVWVYHSSDTYLAGTAMRALLARGENSPDLYQSLIVSPIWDVLSLGQAIRSTRHSYDSRAQPLTGWGLFYQSDDIARIGNWLVHGAPLPTSSRIDRNMLAAAMQNNASNRGLEAGADNIRYNKGFWGLDIAPFINCTKPVWVPFMSGHGGISVVLFPNRTVYYHFSDGYVHRWREAAVQSNKIRSMCL